MKKNTLLGIVVAAVVVTSGVYLYFQWGYPTSSSLSHESAQVPNSKDTAVNNQQKDGLSDINIEREALVDHKNKLKSMLDEQEKAVEFDNLVAERNLEKMDEEAKALIQQMYKETNTTEQEFAEKYKEVFEAMSQ